MSAAGRVKAVIGDAFIEDGDQHGKPTLVIDPSKALEVFEAARNAGFEHLGTMSAVDWPEGAPNDEEGKAVFEVVYNLYSYRHNEHLVITGYVPRDDPHFPSAASVWPAADWHERECYDLYGVVFDGHPNMTRIFLPDDWEGFPHRKDYDLTKEQFVYREGTQDRVTDDPAKGW